MSRSSVTTAGVLALVLAFSASSLAAAQDGEAAEAVENPGTGEISDMLVPQADAYETYAEHIRVLNDCDWLGLMAQYPDNAEVHFNGDAMWQGRADIGAGFAGFVLPPEDGGLCGLTFTEVSRLEVGGTENVKWVADADFLDEPYYGSDAYVTDGQYMVAMVSTFRGSDLVRNDLPDVAADTDDDQGDGTEGAEDDMADVVEDEIKDEMDVSEEEAAALEEIEEGA